MIFKLGQKISYKFVIRKITRYIEPKEFRDKDFVKIDKIKKIEFKRYRNGFIVGKRRIAKIAKYSFEDDDPNTYGTVVHNKTNFIEVYKVTYDMAHTNYVLEEDLREEQ